MALDHNVYINIIVRTKKMTKAIGQANASLSTLGKTTGRILRTMSAFAALFVARAMVRGMGEAVKAAGDLSLQMAHVSRITGLTGESLRGMRKDLLNLSTTMVASVSELADLAIVAARAGIHTRKGMLSIAEASAMLSNVTDLALVPAANAIIKISKAMNLPIIEGKKLGSMIIWVAKQFAASESEITQAMMRMVASGNLLGATAPELAVLSAMTIEMGNNARRAGMQWNRSFFQMGKNLEKAADVMGVTSGEFSVMIEKDFIGSIELLLKKISELPKKMEKLEKIREIFQMVGARSVALFVDKLDKMRDSMNEAGRVMADGTLITADYALILEEFNSQAKLTADTWKRLKIAIAEDALPAITKGMTTLRGVMMAATLAFEGEEGASESFIKSTFGLRDALEDLSKTRKKATAQEMFPEASIENAYKMARALEMVAQARRDIASKGIDSPTGIPEEEADTGTNAVDEQLQTQLANFRLFQEEKAGVLLEGNDMLQSIITEFGDFNKETSLAEKLDFINLEKEKLDSVIKRVGVEKAQEIGLAKLRDQLNLASSNLVKKTWQTNIEGIKGALGTLHSALAAAGQENKAFAQAAKGVAVAMAIINTAQGITKAFADYSWPINFVVGGLIAAAGAIQIGTIIAQGFKKGGLVPGIGQGDTVPAMLEPGELVVPRSEVRNFYNNARPTVNISMEGALIMDDPNTVERFYREYIKDRIQEDIRTRKDVFY